MVENNGNNGLFSYLPAVAKPTESQESHRFDLPKPAQPIIKRLCWGISALQTPSVTGSPQWQTPNRNRVGGKGQFLELMKAINVPVPRFVCIDIKLLVALEQHPFDTYILQPYITDPGLQAKLRANGSTSLTTCKDWIREQPADLQATCLKNLSQFVASAAFHRLVKNLEAAKEIRSEYDTLFPEPSPPVIVRSSGIAEDSFGSAQAGKYASEIHGEADILQTCLKVVASAYQPKACSASGPQTITLIIQEYIDCHFGGVMASYSSLRDNTMVVNYGPGQAKGVVSGQHDIQPHRYDIERKGSSFDAHFTPGKIPVRFVLQPRADGPGYEEIKSEVGQSDTVLDSLDKKSLQQLYDTAEILENRMLSPLIIEFGISKTGQFYLFQVRPDPKLPGALNFTMKAPDKPLIAGELVSEGLCHGQAIWIDPQGTETRTIAERLPQGAIIMTRYSDDWLIAPEIQKKAAGFVFSRGSSTDHIAICLREADKPCLLASPSSASLQDYENTPVTLVCGQFDGTAGGFLLQGDNIPLLKQHQASTTSTDYSSQPKPENSMPPDIQRPDTGFHWLNRQNTRLLAYLSNDGLLNGCLPATHCLQLSMQPQRAEVLQQLKKEVHQFLKETGMFVKGFRQLLCLSLTESEVDNIVELLNEKLTAITKIVENTLSDITQYLPPGQELPLPGGNFQHWLKSCRSLLTLLTSTSTLIQPDEINDINSIHELILWVHREFIRQIESVASGSGLGQMEKITDNRTIFNFIEDEKSGLLNDACRKALIEAPLPRMTCINMPSSVIVNLKLGLHVGTIEMFEEAEGGKKQMLRIKLSDNLLFYDIQNQIRFWFFVRLLRAAHFDKHSAGMKIELNETLQQLTVEYNRIENIESMRSDFITVIRFLSTLCDVDFIPSISIFNNISGQKLTFLQLDKLIKQDLITESNDDFAFKYYLLYWAFRNKSSLYETFIDQQYRPFARYYPDGISLASVQELAANQQIELLLLLVDIDADRFKTVLDDYIQVPQNLNNCIQTQWGREAIMNLIKQHSYRIKDLPQSFQNLDMVRTAFQQNKEHIQHVSPTLRGHKKFMKEVVKCDGRYLKHASEMLKNDREIVLAAVQNDPRAIAYANPKFLKDKNIRYAAFSRAAEMFTTPSYFTTWLSYLDEIYDDNGCLVDRNQIMKALARKPSRGYPSVFQYLPQSCKQDKELAYLALRHSPEVFQFLHASLRDHPDIVWLACQTAKFNIKYVGERMKGNKEFMLHVVTIFGDCLREANKNLQNDREMVLAAVRSFGGAIKYANSQFLQDEEIVLAALGNWTDAVEDAWKLLDQFNLATGKAISRQCIN